jgi:orotate phosphoribosyltransferase-like protein
MANKNIGSVMIREIIRMKNNGFSNFEISLSLEKSRTTVIKYLLAFENSGFSYTELLELSNNDLFVFK